MPEEPKKPAPQKALENCGGCFAILVLVGLMGAITTACDRGRKTQATSVIRESTQITDESIRPLEGKTPEEVKEVQSQAKWWAGGFEYIEAFRRRKDGLPLGYAAQEAGRKLAESRHLKIKDDLHEALRACTQAKEYPDNMVRQFDSKPSPKAEYRIARKAYAALSDYFRCSAESCRAWLTFIDSADRDAFDDADQKAQKALQYWNTYDAERDKIMAMYGISLEGK